MSIDRPFGWISQISPETFASTRRGFWPSLGLVSIDEVAIAGHENIFLFKGSNDYALAYTDLDDDKVLAAQWISYLNEARASLDDLGIKFFFSLLPNKATLLPEDFPLRLRRKITGRAASLLDGLMPAEIEAFYSILGLPARYSMFRKNDSHLTDFGNTVFAETLLRGVGLKPGWDNYEFSEFSEVIHAGDLGRRFSPEARETLRLLKHPHQSVHTVKTVSPMRKSRFLGSGYEATNPDAPHHIRLMLFGNSFVERVPSWGCAMQIVSVVSNFRFLWLPGIDVSEIKAWKPDAVIFQTCERFLSRQPTSNY